MCNPNFENVAAYSLRSEKSRGDLGASGSMRGAVGGRHALGGVQNVAVLHAGPRVRVAVGGARTVPRQ